jgi:hypothetical protein
VIFKLLDQIVKGKPDGFPDIAIGAVVADAKPRIGIYPGQLDASRSARDSSNQPRPQSYLQEITPAKNRKNYKLDQTPLDGTLRCVIVIGKDSPEEQRLTLVETDDYQLSADSTTVGLTAQGKARVDTADSLLVTYSFVGTFALQEFQQLFHADVRAAALSDAEQWASLFVGLMATSHDALIDAYNASSVNYQAGDFVTRHLLDGFSFQGSTTDIATDSATIHLTYQVTGRLELSRVKPPDFGLIEKIVSPGRTASKLLTDIEVKVE